MNPLILDESAFIKVQDTNLVVETTHNFSSKRETAGIFPIGKMTYDTIICPRGFGSITMSAINWLAVHKVSV